MSEKTRFWILLLLLVLSLVLISVLSTNLNKVLLGR